MRLFTAFALPPDLRAEVLRRQAALKTLPFRSWQSPETLHLTLHFLGEVEAALLEPLARTLRDACADVSPFHLELGSLGAFPSRRHARVLFLGMEGQLDRLQDLAATLRPRVLALGIPLEDRPYQPHITLARNPRHAVALPEDRTQADDARTAAASLGWLASELWLFHSTLRPQGAVHEPLAAFPLSGSLPRAR